MKQYILNLSFVKEFVEEVRKEERLKAFTFAREDLKETVKEETKDRVEEIAMDRLNSMLSNVDLHKVVSFNKQMGVIHINGKRVEEGRLSNLKAEAEFFMLSDLWALLYETPKELAQRQMFVSSESLDDIKAGKSILYTLSTQKNIIDLFKSYAPKK